MKGANSKDSTRRETDRSSLTVLTVGPAQGSTGEYWTIKNDVTTSEANDSKCGISENQNQTPHEGLGTIAYKSPMEMLRASRKIDPTWTKDDFGGRCRIVHVEITNDGWILTAYDSYEAACLAYKKQKGGAA